MTKPKLILLSHKRQWYPILQAAIESLFNELPRTNNTRRRAKIRVKFPLNFKAPKKLPKCIIIEQTEEYIVREWNTVTLLDWMYKIDLSPWSSKDIYDKRRNVAMKMNALYKELDMYV